MNTKLKNVLLGCFLASLFFACSGNEEEVVAECETPTVSAVNPNGDSELALLMRQLYVDADTIKQHILKNEGNVTDEFIAKLEKVHGAKPTDPTVKTRKFEAFNKLLILTAKATQEDGNDKMSGFNELVSRCIDCHQSFCPGPIKKIKKLTIDSPLQ